MRNKLLLFSALILSLTVWRLAAQGVPAIGLPFGGGATGPNGFTVLETITIDHTKVPSSDQTDFPVLINGTYSFLKTVANGGKVTSGSGYDVLFTSDSGCTTNLNWEVEQAPGASTGTATYWVKVPTVSHTTDTVIYWCVGKSSITTDQSNPTGTWDSHYLAVFHLSSTWTDSTSNGPRTLSCSGCIPSYVSGQNYNASNNNASQHPDGSGTGLPTGSSITATIEVWFKLASITTDQTLAGWGASSGLGAPGTGSLFRIWSGNTQIGLDNFGGGSYYNYTPDTTTWHHAVGTSNGTVSTALFYFDGSSVGTQTGTGFSVGNNCIGISALPCHTSAASAVNGAVDEYRVSNIARSADWIATEYNNQSSPSTFYTVTP